MNSVTQANQALVSKLAVITSLRAQKAASKISEEQSALQILIDVRSTETQPLLTAYISAVNTFVGSFNPVPTSTGPTGSSS